MSQRQKSCVNLRLTMGVSARYCMQMTAADPGGFVGFGQTPLRPGVVVENARTAWLYQSSSVRDIFTEIVPQLYTT